MGNSRKYPNKKNPSWEDLQQFGCKKVGEVILLPEEGPVPVCSFCKREYYWSHATDEWVHPFNKEWDAYWREPPTQEELKSENHD